MANYTGEQLYGAGVDIPELTAGTQYNFVMAIPTELRGSGYFVIETTLNSNGNYGGRPTNAIGVYSDFVNEPEGGFLTSSYVSSIVCTRTSPDAVSYKFTPTVTIAAGSSKMRSTGGIGLELTTTVIPATNHITTQGGDSIITQNGDQIIIN